MMDDLRQLWRRARHPADAFRELALQDPAWLPSLGRMLLLRVPVALVAWCIGIVKLSALYAGIRSLEGPVWTRVMELLPGLNLDLDPQDLRALVSGLPQPPPLGTLLAWGLVVVPVGILGLWLHNAAWDHGCLWLLGGLKKHRGPRRTLSAESEAMAVGVFAAVASLLGDIPFLGLLLGLPLALLTLYFWVLRGFSLAAFHEVEPWRGVTATVLHLVLATCCAGCLLALLAFIIAFPVAPG